jgi:hypothetical protein
VSVNFAFEASDHKLNAFGIIADPETVTLGLRAAFIRKVRRAH